jgi:hypothetical protein
MTEPTWPETVMAGKLFAVLTASEGLFQSDQLALHLESASIDHGIIRLELNDGRQFELAVRQVK